MKCFSWTLDTVGLFAAGVEDLAQGLSAMTSRPELLPGAAIKAPRIGIVTQDFAGAPEPASAEALRIAAKAAERAGASVRTLALPDIVAEAWRIHPNVQEFEAHQALAWEYRDAITTPCRRCCAAGSMKAWARPPADYDAARSIAQPRPQGAGEASSTMSTCC